MTAWRSRGGVLDDSAEPVELLAVAVWKSAKVSSMPGAVDTTMGARLQKSR
jgi:hypothetical protein